MAEPTTFKPTFEQWYSIQADTYGLKQNPEDDPMYDWRAAYEAGAKADREGQWPKEFETRVETVDLPTTEVTRREVTPEAAPEPPPKAPPTQPAVFKRDQPFDFMEDKESPQFDVLSYKKSEREISDIVYKFNRGVYDNMTTVADLDANYYIDKNSLGFIALKENPDLFDAIKAKGPLGWGETWQRMDKWGIVPYAGDVSEIISTVKIYNLIQKNLRGEILSSKEQEDLSEFAWDMIEMDIRGQAWDGKFLQGIYRMPAFVGEFMTTGAVMKQLGKTAAMKGAKKVIAKGMRKYLRGRIAKGLFKVGVEGTVRTFLNPIAFRKHYVQRKLHDSIAVTDRGEVIFREASQNPAMTFVKAFGDVWVEMASETAGAHLLTPVGKRITKQLPKGLKDAFSKFVRKETGKPVKGLRRMLGFDGLVEEIGEERIADFLRVTLDLDPTEGYSFDQYGQALFPEWEDLLIEAGIIATHGTMSRSVVSLYNKVRVDKKISDKLELGRILHEIDSLSENQRQSILEDVAGRETAEDKGKLAEALSAYKTTITEAGVPEAEADKMVKLWDAFTTVSVSKLKEKGVDTTRAKFIAERAPMIAAAEKAKGLFQAGLGRFVKDLGFIEEETDTQYKIGGEWYSKRIITADKISEKAPTPKEFNDFVIRKAVEYFGETDNFSETGYITTDGKMLDLSDKREGGQPGTRSKDHREINFLEVAFPHADPNLGNSTDMVAFMDMGNIRFKPESNGFELHIKPTNQQKKVLKNYINEMNGNVIVDLYTVGKRKTKDSVEYQTGTRAEKILKDIDDFYAGKKIKKLSDVAKFHTMLEKPALYQPKRGAYDPAKNLITLLPTADRSTFLHESAHAFFEFYLRNMPEDLKAVFDWVGIKQKPLNELTNDEYRRLQESFAKGFEAYIMEGKAPNTRLAEIFQTFLEWLLEIYNNVTGLNIRLSDPVRQLYQDMLDVEADIEVEIDARITPELKAKALTLYQEAKEQIEKLKKRRKAIIKKYGKKAKADLAEVEADIKELETMTFGVRRAAMVREAEAVYDELPISEVIEGKIRISPAYEAMMKRYDIPANVKTTSAAARTVDEWASDLGMTETEVLDRVAEVRSKSNFVNEYIAKEIQAMREFAVPEAEIRKKMDDTIAKLKEDVKKGDVTELQREVISTIRDMNIDNADKVRFLSQIQKAKTPYSQRRVLMDMLEMERRYWEKQQRNLLDVKIQKMLRQTKAKAVAGVTKGKYNYADNKFFTELRDINKLTQKEALEKSEAFQDIPPDEVLSNEEVLLRAFTNYKAYGKSKGSLELFEVVYAGLNKAIADAKEAKNEKDFQDKLEAREKTKSFLEGVRTRRYKGDSKALTTKILNVYRVGSLMSGANMWSLINSIAGKKVADQLNLEHPELTRDTAIFQDVRDTVRQSLEILELENDTDFFKLLDQYNSEEYTLVEQDPRYEEEYITREFSRMGIIDIYNAIKNEKTKNDYYRVYGENAVNELLAELTEKEMAWADMLMEKAQESYEEVNQVHIKQTGVDLRQVENYWPATSVKPQALVNDNLVNEVILASFQKERVKGATTPIPMDAWRKLNSHLSGAHHVIDVMTAWRDVRKIIDSETVKNKIERKYGEGVYKTLVLQTNALSLTGLRDQSNVVSSVTRKMFKNWVKAKIALNPSVFVKQLISVVNYTENIPVNYWMKYFAEGMLHPAKTQKFMFENSPYLEARYSKGYSEDITRALSEGKKLAREKSMNKILTSLVRMGDIGAIVYGGYPMIRYLQEVKGLSRAEAVKQFELSTVRSQQSGLASSLDLAQQSKNPFVNFFFAFKNTPKQYMRKISDAWIMYYNGDISAGELAKILTIYMVVQPALFGAVAQAMRHLLYDDEDDYLDDVSSNILTSYTNAFPIIGDVAKYNVNRIIADIQGDRRPWKMFSQPMLSDIERLNANVYKLMDKNFDEMDIFDLLGVMGTPIELGTGFPIQTLERPFKKRLAPNKKIKRRTL